MSNSEARSHPSKRASILRLIENKKANSLKIMRQEDLNIAQRISRGDETAMKEVYDLYSGPLFNFVKNWSADPHAAGDIVHEAMMVVWRRADRYQGRSSLKSWIFSIAKNKAIDLNRKSSRMIYTDEDMDAIDAEVSPIEALENSQNASTIKSAISKLSDTHKRMIHLAFYEDLSYREISEIEGCPVGTVKTRVLHAKKLLMKDLAALEK